MSFQMKIGFLGGTVFFSGGTLYPSANYATTVISVIPTAVARRVL